MDKPQIRERLRREIFNNIQFERVLAAFRKGFLEGRGTEHIPDMVSLACQCFNTEYIWPVSKEEQRAVLCLKERLTSIRDLIVFAMYEPLWTVREAAFQLGLDRDADAKEIFTRQICEPAEEQEIKKSIPSFGVSDDPISRAVREQYEESPYPRWMDLTLPKPLEFQTTMRGRFPFLKSVELRYPVQILVAGCGTGQHPIEVAARYPNAQVTAIDFSKSSLAYAIRQARRYKVPNLNFLHGDILNLEMREKFDCVEATGVLHHMADLGDGLRILARALKPGGFMELGLYSRRAHAVLHEAKRIVCDRNVGTSSSELREVRQEIIRRTTGSTKAPLNMADFYYMSGFRDLLCHACETSFYPAEIKPVMESVGLTLLGYCGIDSLARARYVETFPQDPYMRDFDLVDTFESDHPDLFGGSMQFFWVQAK